MQGWGKRCSPHYHYHCKLIDCFAECLWSVKTDKLFQKVWGICKVKGTIRWFTCCFCIMFITGSQEVMDWFVCSSTKNINQQGICYRNEALFEGSFWQDTLQYGKSSNTFSQLFFLTDKCNFIYSSQSTTTIGNDGKTKKNLKKPFGSTRKLGESVK